MIMIFFSCSTESHTSSSHVNSSFFDTNQSFELIALKTEHDTTSSDYFICEGWSIESVNLSLILKTVKSISGEEQHHLFDHLPCNLVGQLKQNEKVYDISINGGAWLTISNPDTTMIFGNFDKSNNAYFLSEVQAEEDL